MCAPATTCAEVLAAMGNAEPATTVPVIPNATSAGMMTALRILRILPSSDLGCVRQYHRRVDVLGNDQDMEFGQLI